MSYNNYRGYNRYNNRGYNNRNNYHYNPHQEKKEIKPKVQVDFEAENWKEQIKRPATDKREKTTDVLNTKGSSFEDFQLSKKLLLGIFEHGFENPSPIQEATIPRVLWGDSILARAKNGTGKTGAFAIPCLQKIDPKLSHIQCLVLLPTRELALQTANVLKQLGKYLDLEEKIVTSTGGTDLKHDIIRLKRDVRIVVGTPGRLQDLAKRREGRATLILDKCKLVVFDEADKLLSTDFKPAVTALLEHTPEDRQLLLFSATFPSTIKEFKQKWLKECEVINLMDELTLKGISQYYAFVDEKEKVHCLYALFKKLKKTDQCIVFCNSVNRVELLCRKMTNLGFACYYIHGQMGQQHRNRVFHNFRNNAKCKFLVCTDIFTRGIDVKSVNVVINFDFPRSANTYLHRIGRSGRFGHKGLAINFITTTDRYNLCCIESHLNTEVAPIPNEINEELY